MNDEYRTLEAEKGGFMKILNAKLLCFKIVITANFWPKRRKKNSR
jgi:hypothetical protein